jgi:hypothetical protein
MLIYDWEYNNKILADILPTYERKHLMCVLLSFLQLALSRYN